MNIRTLAAPSRLRLAVQTAFTLFCLWIGWRFYQFILWTQNATDTFTPRPPSVEGFLPISAFMALKRLALTGQWDPVHPAGLTILIAAILMALLLRKGFCAYVCPVGLVHNLLERAGRALGIAREPGPRLAAALGTPKYLLLAFFTWSTWFAMDLRAAESFMRGTYNMTADARMLDFFLSPSGTSLAVLAVLAVLALFVRNFWCRFLCPYGALLGLAALLSPLALKRDADTCIDCKRCTQTCPQGIRVHAKTRVNTAQCIGCMQCAQACPVPDCLTPRVATKQVPLHYAAIGCVALLLALWLWAVATNHWQSSLPPAMLKRLYMMAS